jgi:hypothetical protein
MNIKEMFYYRIQLQQNQDYDNPHCLPECTRLSIITTTIIIEIH